MSTAIFFCRWLTQIKFHSFILSKGKQHPIYADDVMLSLILSSPQCQGLMTVPKSQQKFQAASTKVARSWTCHPFWSSRTAPLFAQATDSLCSVCHLSLKDTCLVCNGNCFPWYLQFSWNWLEETLVFTYVANPTRYAELSTCCSQINTDTEAS